MGWVEWGQGCRRGYGWRSGLPAAVRGWCGVQISPASADLAASHSFQGPAAAGGWHYITRVEDVERAHQVPWPHAQFFNQMGFGRDGATASGRPPSPASGWQFVQPVQQGGHVPPISARDGRMHSGRRCPGPFLRSGRHLCRNTG